MTYGELAKLDMEAYDSLPGWVREYVANHPCSLDARYLAFRWRVLEAVRIPDAAKRRNMQSVLHDCSQKALCEGRN